MPEQGQIFTVQLSNKSVVSLRILPYFPPTAHRLKLFPFTYRLSSLRYGNLRFFVLIDYPVSKCSFPCLPIRFDFRCLSVPYPLCDNCVDKGQLTLFCSFFQTTMTPSHISVVSDYCLKLFYPLLVSPTGTRDGRASLTSRPYHSLVSCADSQQTQPTAFASRHHASATLEPISFCNWQLNVFHRLRNGLRHPICDGRCRAHGHYEFTLLLPSK